MEPNVECCNAFNNPPEVEFPGESPPKFSFVGGVELEGGVELDGFGIPAIKYAPSLVAVDTAPLTVRKDSERLEPCGLAGGAHRLKLGIGSVFDARGDAA